MTFNTEKCEVAFLTRTARTAGTLSKARTSCDNRSASDDPGGNAETRSMGMQHDELDAPADQHRLRESH